MARALVKGRVEREPELDGIIDSWKANPRKQAGQSLSSRTHPLTHLSDFRGRSSKAPNERNGIAVAKQEDTMDKLKH